MKKRRLLKAQKAGGKAIKEKYGIEYFRKLGSRGGKKSARIRWGVDRQAVLASK
jgi:hypothetical protein